MGRRDVERVQYAGDARVVDAAMPAGHDRPMSEESDDRLDAREAARVRRRDREAGARGQDLMRPGMGKVFKQIQDSWGRKASTIRRARDQMR